MWYFNCAKVISTKVKEAINMTNKKTKYDALKLQNQVCFPLYACSKELVRQYSPHLRKLDLTYTQYVVMMVMWEKETVTSRELADCTHLDYGTLTPVLKRLESADYITRKRSLEDERLLILTLTDTGKKLKDKAVDLPSCMAKCMGLTADEFKELYRLTHKALKNMESIETED